MQEIAIRVRIREQEQLGLAEYERIVGSVATVAALIAWLPSTDERLVLRGRGTEPARVETVTHGTDFEMLVVLDQRALATERAAGAVAALIEAARNDGVEASSTGVAGEIDRLDRLAPRGRTVAERALRTFLEQAHADVVDRRATAKVRAASALVRLAEEGAELLVERVDDAAADEITTTLVTDSVPDAGDVVVIPETPDEAAIMADAPVVVSEVPTTMPIAPPLPTGNGVPRASDDSSAEPSAAADAAEAKAKAKAAKQNAKAAEKVVAEATSFAKEATAAVKAIAKTGTKADRKRAVTTADEAKAAAKTAKKLVERATAKADKAKKRAKKAKKAAK
ncbi:hypothetical protein [Curtobacterium sp. RRHDQ10]|uniref:hypothetical protein n=1 Tax=Curtobacterium phyllosphaerae TaxID=3413379 RepID=UPI003BF0DA50